MEFREYFDKIMQEVKGFNFATETYIELLYQEQVTIDNAIAAIKNGN